MWDVEVTDEFKHRWDRLTVDQQESVTDRVGLLSERGPNLGRPVVDRIQQSRHHNMKELRTSQGGALRVLFMFDPRRQVILLIGGDKSGDGTPGTKQPYRRPMTSSTSTWPNCMTKD